MFQAKLVGDKVCARPGPWVWHASWAASQALRWGRGRALRRFQAELGSLLGAEAPHFYGVI